MSFRGELFDENRKAATEMLHFYSLLEKLVALRDEIDQLIKKERLDFVVREIIRAVDREEE